MGATGSPTLTYQWRRGGTAITGATSPTYTIATTVASDNGASFDCVVTNGFGSATTNVATLTVTNNAPPTATIDSPVAGTTYHGGQTFNYSGSGTDPETGSLGAAAFTWEVVFHHDSHTHPFVQPTTGSKTGSFVIPTQGEVSSNVYYRIRVTVRDPQGAMTTVERDIIPETATISIASSPSGAQVTLDGQPVTTPHSVVGVVGMQRTLGIASTTQTLNGSPYAFTSWSDGGAATHTIATPVTNTTYTATFDPTPCTYTLSSQSRTVTAAGGAYTVNVTAPSGCSWTAVSNDPWLSVTSGATGQGSGTINYSVQVSTGPQRVGTITIAANTFSVTQTAALGCVYSINPTSQSHASGSGTGGIDVTTAAGCQWTSVSNTAWITVTPGTENGSGTGTTSYSVAANIGPQRTGSITVASKTFSVTQSSGCTYSINPTTQTYPASSATGSVGLATGAGCAWSAVSNNGWITVTSGANGSGAGTTNYSVAANSGAQRSGSITIGGQAFNITQAGACAYTISPTSRTHASASGSGSIGVTAGAGCAWSAVSNNAWITVTSGASGSGNGTTNYSVAANTGAQRNGSITIAGQTFSVTQNQGTPCTYSLAPPYSMFSATAGAGSLTVITGASCSWTAVSGASWLTMPQGATGTGGGTLNYSFTANTGASRATTIVLGGQTHWVIQGAACATSITPATRVVGPGTTTGDTIIVTASSSCGWTAVSTVSWITMTAPFSWYTGNATVGYTVASNPGATRTGTIELGGRIFTLTQGASGCTYTISPTTSPTFAASGGTGTVTVTTGATCVWGAQSNNTWVTVTAGATGTGSGVVNYSVASRGSGSRTGTITIAGATFTVRQ